MSQTIQLPEPCRVELLKLYAQSQQAKRFYESHVDLVLRALGLDPRDQNHVDLDSGLITQVEQKDGN